jgi:hypothetical protein
VTSFVAICRSKCCVPFQYHPRTYSARLSHLILPRLNIRVWSVGEFKRCRFSLALRNCVKFGFRTKYVLHHFVLQMFTSPVLLHVISVAVCNRNTCCSYKPNETHSLSFHYCQSLYSIKPYGYSHMFQFN